MARYAELTSRSGSSSQRRNYFGRTTTRWGRSRRRDLDGRSDVVNQRGGVSTKPATSMAYGFVVVTFGHVPIRASQSPTHCNALKFS
nr:hypothetical protein JVH1_4758 [Rhodococcus sp. JVH1]